MGLVMTFHKAQGRTMAKVILVLAKRPAGFHLMLHSGLLASLTRIENHNDIRILCSKCEDLSYLTTLVPDDYFMAWRKGFDKVEGGVWDEKKSLEAWHDIQRKKKRLKRKQKTNSSGTFFSRK
eukprot:9459651-Ditylum_brightwellii.AAC.1